MMSDRKGRDRFSARRIRAGVPPFLNTLPLVFGLQKSDEFALSAHPPSALCALAERGAIDIGLLPAADIFERPDFKIIKSSCVSSFGEVGSVAVFSKLPLAEIKSVAVDSGSSSSAMMLRIVLEIFTAAKPVYKKRKFGARFFSGVDAGLAIGNAGLRLSHFPPEGFPLRFDLGAIWTEKTGLPFVYAVFAARAKLGSDFNLRALEDALVRSKTTGVRATARIAADEHSKLGLPEAVCRDYLEKKIRYNFASAELKGLAEFGRLISRLRKTGAPLESVNFHRPELGAQT